MSGNSHNYGRKGSAIGKIFVAFALFIILLIWVYSKNQAFLPN
jgi:Na+-driven multidrug efflux pump